MKRQSGLFLLFAGVACAALALVGTWMPSFAQDATGRIVGTVYDQSGAVVPGVHVVVTNAGTKVTRETKTDQTGFYQVLSLPIGNYTVSADQKGFSPITTSANKLEINQSLKVDITLKVGAETQTVKVETTPPTVETINPTMGSSVSAQAIQDAPLNGRNALDLALLQPGVLPADNPGNGGARSASTAFSISGGRNDSNTFILDGGANNDLLDNQVVYNPNPDAIQEFRVLTSNFTAEYGRNGGGIVTVVTKSGTNAFHGTAFEYNRNNAYNANDFISNSLGEPRAVLKRNQFGGTLGGPIKKNKLFFFVSYQGQRQNQLVPSGLGQTFTPAELTGDFSHASPQSQNAVICFLNGLPQGATPAGQLANPCQGAGAAIPANTFFQSNPALAAQGIIDPTKIDPVAQAYIKAGLIPVTSTGAFSFQNPAADNRNEVTGKFDFDLSEKDHFNATLGRADTAMLNSGGTAVAAFGNTSNVHRQFFNFAYTRIVSPTMLNEFRTTAQRVDILQAVPATKLGTPASFGSAITPDNPTAPPLLTFPQMSAGFSPQGPSVLFDNTFGYSDTFSWTHGRHTMKFGAAFSAYQDNQVFDFFVDGNFDFVPSIDGATTFGAGDPFANFLVGVPDFLFQAPAAPSNIRSKATYIFGQDEFHVTRNLVLTYGLRYEYSTPKSDTLGRTFTIVPGQQSAVFPNAPVGLLFPGDKGAPAGSNFPQSKNFAPRLGFAWQPFRDSKTSVRGGFGIFYDVLKAEDNFQFNGQFPFASTAFIGSGFGPGSFDPTIAPAVTSGFGFLTDPFGSTGNPNPFPSKPIDHNIQFLSTFGGAGVFFVDPNLRTPYTYQYNLSIEHEIARKTTLEAAYVGSSSHGLTGLKDINPFDPATLNTPNQTRFLNEAAGQGAFGFLPQFMNVANANYNALQIALREQPTEIRYLGRTYFTLGYTFAHSIDDASGFRNNNAQVPFFQPQLFRASSDFDVRHTLTFSGAWDLPFNRGPKMLVKGWSLFPILSWRTGFPITITAGLPTLNSSPGPSGAGDGGLVNANLVSPVQYTNGHNSQTFNTNNNGPQTGFFFFDPRAFSATVASGYGTAARNLLRGPGRTNMDFSLAKTTPIFRERVNLKLSLDAFNLFNHTQFQTIGNDAAAGNLGQVLSTYIPRELQLGAHILF